MAAMLLTHLLAETPTSDQDTWRAIEWGGVVICAVILLILVFRTAQKNCAGTETGPPAGFTLSDLRQLVKDGKMTPDEFERAKAKILVAHQRASSIKPAQETVEQKKPKTED